MTLIAIAWDDDAGRDGRGAVRLLDQTLLPGTTAYREIVTTDELVVAIAELAVRGAPALGVAGALGVVLAMDEGAREGWDDAQVQAAVDRVRHARPTAVNLAWGVDQVRPLMGRAAMPCSSPRAGSPPRTRPPTASCPGSAPTGCSPGSTGPGCGCSPTATPARSPRRPGAPPSGVIRELHARDRLELVYADETRPLLQGSRLTAFELAADGIPHRVQADGAAASTILRGLVDLAVVGADRIAANGDAANKIGTLGVALACRDAGIPFMVAAPWSTVDLSMADGSHIEIEERPGEEVTVLGGVRLAPEASPGFNPAFDVTPARLVDAVATERGVAEPRTGTDLRAFA